MEDRIIRIEEKLAYMEQTVHELNELVWKLSQEFSQMQKQMRDIRSSATPVDPHRKAEDDIPPHWGGPR